MLKTLKEVINNQSGSVIVLITLALLALVASMALVIDVGLVFAQRIKASNAIDAAVMAGVRELPQDPLAAIEVAQTYAQMNGLEIEEVDFEISEDQVPRDGSTKNSPCILLRYWALNQDRCRPRLLPAWGQQSLP